MNINTANAKYSSIVKIGEQAKKLSAESGQPYLMLNRGVNSVCPLHLNQIARNIDFNSTEIQVYPDYRGLLKLRKSINLEFFNGSTKPDNIYITGGGMNGLDLVFQTLSLKKVLLPEYFWGSYLHVLNIRHIDSGYYNQPSDIVASAGKENADAIIICDPNNPIGNKYPDELLLNVIEELNKKNIAIIVDCPYRRIFYDKTDGFYTQLLQFENVIIVDSFSKSLGLSGQRIGFVHSVNEQFNYELGLRLMYSTNGINAFSQRLVNLLLSEQDGINAVQEFKKTTCEHIEKNIRYLSQKNILAHDFYTESEPKGIFVVANKSEEELLQNKIAAISLSYFTKNKKEFASAYSRICVSVPHDELTTFFDKF
jgi:aspartate aminotransferase